VDSLRLMGFGWLPQYSVEDGLGEIIHSLSAVAAQPAV